MLRPSLWHAAGKKAQKKLLVKAQPKALINTAFGAFPVALGQPLSERQALASDAMPMSKPMPMAMAMAMPMAMPMAGVYYK